MEKLKIEQSLKNSKKYHLHVYDILNSTNEHLKQLAAKGEQAWTVTVAEQQTAGKGRGNRHWESQAEKGLWFSLLLRPNCTPRQLNVLNLFSAYILALYLEKELAVFGARHYNIKLKWPNDLYLEGKKISGILLESGFSSNKIKYLIIGIGLNVNHSPDDFSPEIRDKAGSLKMFSGHCWNREELLAGYLDYFYQQYHLYFPHKWLKIVGLYRTKVLYLQKKITVNLNTHTITGKFSGLTPEGYMILTGDGQKKIITGGDVYSL